jgi:hypothetical protein
MHLAADYIPPRPTAGTAASASSTPTIRSVAHQW